MFAGAIDSHFESRNPQLEKQQVQVRYEVELGG